LGRFFNAGRLAAAAIAVAASACRAGTSDTSAPHPVTTQVSNWFRDVTGAARLNFVHDAGPASTYYFPSLMGSGAALFDADNDGRLDVYLVQNGGPNSQASNRFFRQLADGTFLDMTSDSGLGVVGWGMGATTGDVNNDGSVDVLVTEYGRIRLFVNDGRGRFAEAAGSGLNDSQWATAAVFFDYDRDGWLDLFVGNYVEFRAQNRCQDRAGRPDFCGPQSFPSVVSRLFHNRGRGSATFEDVTISSGIAGTRGSALGAVALDFTGDGWPDILVANDGAANTLWVNQKNGAFKDEAVERGIAYDASGRPQANMGIAVGDADGDGLTDLFVTHLPSEFHIGWFQGPPGLYQDRTREMGLNAPAWRSTGFGTLFADFDQDGDLDLPVVNGAVKRPDTAPLLGDTAAWWSAYAERNQLFENDGKGRFTDVSSANPVFSEPAGVSRGLAMGDVDGDGATDLLVTRAGASARLFRNVVANRGHWLRVRALDPSLGGRDAYGAQVSVVAGGRTWVRHITQSLSYLSSSAPDAHVGLGALDRVDAVTVLWPDGREERFAGGPVDRVYVLRKGSGT
jgi:enediyne biosynthesis protein E4